MDDAPHPRRRLAVVTSHPIQYYAPWFRHLARDGGKRGDLDLRVFYLWGEGTAARHDPGFGHVVRWDVPLLDGYPHEFVPNVSPRPGTDHFWGLRNPSLLGRLTAFRPDAALLLGYNYASFLRLLLSPRLRRPFSLLLRGDSHRLVWSAATSRRETFRRWVITRIFRRFAAGLAVGRANQDYLRQHGFPENRIFFCPHAVDGDRFNADVEGTRRGAAEWRASLGIPAGSQVVLFAGKLEPKKRPQDLLNAFTALGPPQPAERVLLIVGAGSLREQLLILAAGRPDIIFAPFQNQSFMPRTYATADLFVLPSFGPGETWGLAVQEAQCLGRPVVVSSHVGCGPDLVEHGENGLIFPAGDVTALAAALRTALMDPERLRRWGERGRLLVNTRYTYAQATVGLRAALDVLFPLSIAPQTVGKSLQPS